MKRSYARSVTLSYASIVLSAAIALLFTPFLVSSLGIEGYGLMSLSIAFLAYLNIMDFGLNDSLIRYFVSHRDDSAATQGFLSRMLALYLGIGGLILVSGFVLSAVFPALFAQTMSPEQIDELRDMIKVMALGAAVLIGFNPVSALAYAHERHFFMQLADTAILIASTLITIILLLQGYGAFSVVAVTAFGKIVKALTCIVYVRISIGARVRFERPEAAELKRILRYAAPIFVSVLAGALFWRLDNVLIGAMLGAAPIAIYAIGVTFNKYFMSFATALSRVMTPEIIRQVEQGADANKLTDMMIQISRIQAIFLLLILSGLIVFGQRFLILWLGPQFAPAYWIMLAILTPFTFELTGNARNIILQVKGLYWYKSAITFVMAALNVPLTLILLRTMGVLGAAVSTGIAILVGYFLIALLLKVKVGIEMGRYFIQTVRGIVPLAVVLTVTGLLTEPFLPQGWLPLIAGAATYAGIFGLVVYFFGANQEERAFIAHFLSRFRMRGAGNV